MTGEDHPITVAPSMTTELIPYEDDRSHDGPKMALLEPMQRKFVLLMLSTTPSEGQEGRCALAAGYAHTQSGYNLMRNAKVIDALHEESAKKVLAAAQIGVMVMVEVALDPLHKDRYKAAKDLAAMSGFSPISKQEIKVEHGQTDDKAKIARIVENAQRLGLDPAVLLGRAGIVVDAEFTVIEDKRFEDVQW